jgi:hypothetical protein
MRELKRLPGGIGARRLGVAAAVAAFGLVTTAPAFADPPWWHEHHRAYRHEYRPDYYGYGYAVRPPPAVVYAGPPAYYAPPPPPVYYAPPPVVYGAPPVVYGAPGLSLGVTIPIR